ncbi:competence type IV pilus minor pilin ComGD [Streptococcus devriesei]|uniref:competence type IV pilus minor pilin ComGD n=1 Tax=Streptococcus devriesei TaxID=231233 RepID=UPI0005641E52|nr:competence type IV pilus minor pilin ComGD [Streptococcus devriesei]
MWRIKAFTLLESLITLAITAFLILSLSGGINQTFASVKEQLFFLSFEHLYRDTQKLSALTQQEMTLTLDKGQISNGVETLDVPEDITLEKSMALNFDQAGGNSSLAKLSFQTPKKTVTYQLYIGSGQYKKTENESLHSP